MKFPSSLRLSALALVSSLALTGCIDSGGESDAEDDDTIRIGISLPLTGDYAEPGKGIQRGYEAWAEWTNENGGLLGKQVELEILDDQSSAERVAQDYERLINQDNVDLIVGPFSTRLVIPAAQVAQDYGFVFIEPAGAAPEVFEQGFENLFYAAPAVANDHYNHLADYIEQMPADQRPKTVAVASMDDPFAMGTAYGLRDKLDEMGIKIVVDEVYPPNTTNFDSIAAKIADSNADMVIGGTQYQDAVNLILALQQLDYQPKMAAFSTAPTEPEFGKAIGGKTEGILAPTGYTPQADYPSNQEFVDFYTETYGEAPSEDQANAWTTGQVLAAAVEAADCAESALEDPECHQTMIDWLHENEVETVVGPLSWDEAGRPQSAHMVQQWIDGEIRIVLPEEQAEADLIAVKPAW